MPPTTPTDPWKDVDPNVGHSARYVDGVIGGITISAREVAHDPHRAWLESVARNVGLLMV